MGFFNNFPYTNFHELNSDWIIQNLKDLIDKYPGMIADIQSLVDSLAKRVAELQGDVGDLQLDGLKKNLTAILSEYMPAMIYPEITHAGYIVYNIPGTWDAITFNTTGLDIELESQPEYGHLVLSY